jgi:hypothetical protein
LFNDPDKIAKKTMNKIYCFILAFIISLAACKKDETKPVTMTPDEWWNSLSRDWRNCLYNSSKTSSDTYIYSGKYLQSKIIGLNCNGYNFTNLDPVRYLSNLERLLCIDTTLKDIRALIYLKKLKDVNLGGTGILDITSLSNSTDMEYLYFNSTKVNNIETVRNFKKLKELQFLRTNVENINSLTQLKCLKELIFDESPVVSIKPIMENDSLEWLGCWMTKVPESEVIEFKSKHPKCKVDY